MEKNEGTCWEVFDKATFQPVILVGVVDIRIKKKTTRDEKSAILSIIGLGRSLMKGQSGGDLREKEYLEVMAQSQVAWVGSASRSRDATGGRGNAWAPKKGKKSQNTGSNERSTAGKGQEKKSIAVATKHHERGEEA